MNSQSARYNMIEQQVRPWDVLDQRILNIMSRISREAFIPEAYRGLAYADTRLPLDSGRKTLNPNIEGRILQALTLGEQDRVLEVGTGSGYLTACLAALCRHVDSIEWEPSIADLAESQLKELGTTNYRILRGNWQSTCEKGDQYDAILFTGSVPELPMFCKEKLTINGRLFVVLGETDSPVHRATMVTRVSETEWTQKALFETWLDPLVAVKA